MSIKVEYIKILKMWRAEYRDEIGTLGLGFTAKNKEDAIFALGMSMGREPEKFSRPLGDYFNKPISNERLRLCSAWWNYQSKP
jgi:hypothetical protein